MYPINASKLCYMLDLYYNSSCVLIFYYFIKKRKQFDMMHLYFSIFKFILFPESLELQQN